MVILDGGKIFRLIVTLALILITIVVDIIMHFRIFASGNLTPRNNSAISSIVKLSATGNNAANLWKLLDITEDVVIILDRGKIFRLIATLALILIPIVVDTTTRSETSASGNLTSKNNPAIPSIIEASAAGNDTVNLLTNILGNFFGNSSQNTSSTDLATPATDFFVSFPAAFFALSRE